jgi:hypothetical protein
MKKFRDKKGNVYYSSKVNGRTTYKMYTPPTYDQEGDIDNDPYYSDDSEMRVSLHDDGEKDYLKVPLNRFYQLKDYDMYIYPYGRDRKFRSLKCISFLIGDDSSIIDDSNLISNGHDEDYGFDIERLVDSLIEADKEDLIRFVFREDLKVFADLKKLSSLITTF